jgi:hypothetical protein
LANHREDGDWQRTCSAFSDTEPLARPLRRDSLPADAVPQPEPGGLLAEGVLTVPRGSVSILDRFAKAKKLPTVGRVSGGGVRKVYYRNPDKVRVFRGKRVNGSRLAGKSRG